MAESSIVLCDLKLQNSIQQNGEECRVECPFREGDIVPPPCPLLHSHSAVGFWHGDLSKTRLDILRSFLLLLFTICLFILFALSVFWGVHFEVNENLHKLTVNVVDFDGTVAPYVGMSLDPPLIGPLATEIAVRLRKDSTPTLGFTIVDPARYNYDAYEARHDVYNFNAWAAIIVHANASALLRQAVAAGNSSYDPTGAVQIVYLSARDSNTVSSFVAPQLRRFTTMLVAAFGPTWANETVGDRSRIKRENLAKAARAVNPGVVPLMLDLRPFQPIVATPAVTIGLIYLIITSFFSFSFFLPTHMKYVSSTGHPPLRFRQLIVWRWVATITAYFFLSLCYSLVSLAFQFPFTAPPASPLEPAPPGGATSYGQATFVVYWMLNWVSMSALGLPCENMAMIIGSPWTALWLIFWVITNVCTSFYATELSPSFYQWGYAWPLHNVVEASRQILFDLHSQIGKNLVVLMAWVVISTALFPFCCYFMRWKGRRETQLVERSETSTWLGRAVEQLIDCGGMRVRGRRFGKVLP